MSTDRFCIQDTPLSCEPTLLPEPNHVMINHLYALSIKDGVMVISSTQRFVLFNIGSYHTALTVLSGL
jgi:hypothetical protein